MEKNPAQRSAERRCRRGGADKDALSGLANRDSAVSLMGKTPVRQLSALLRACTLYAGDNSGPAHCCGVRVPEIGIHPGANEWGPVVKPAMALAQNKAAIDAI